MRRVWGPLARLSRVRYPAAMADNHGKPRNRRREHWARESVCPPARGDTPEILAVKSLFAKPFLREDEVKLVKPLCNSCPVKSECFDWAIVHTEWGYYGGFTRKQRKEFYGLTEDLAVRAVKEGWLEGDYNRLSEDMLRTVRARAAQEIAREKEEAAKRKKKPIIVVTPTEFDWSLPEALPVLQFS